LHDGLQAVDGIVQSRDDAGWRNLTEAEKEHQTEGFHVIVILERFQDTFNEGRQVDLGETCAELDHQ